MENVKDGRLKVQGRAAFVCSRETIKADNDHSGDRWWLMTKFNCLDLFPSSFLFFLFVYTRKAICWTTKTVIGEGFCCCCRSRRTNHHRLCQKEHKIVEQRTSRGRRKGGWKMCVYGMEKTGHTARPTFPTFLRPLINQSISGTDCSQTVCMHTHSACPHHNLCTFILCLFDCSAETQKSRRVLDAFISLAFFQESTRWVNRGELSACELCVCA